MVQVWFDPSRCGQSFQGKIESKTTFRLSFRRPWVSSRGTKCPGWVCMPIRTCQVCRLHPVGSRPTLPRHCRSPTRPSCPARLCQCPPRSRSRKPCCRSALGSSSRNPRRQTDQGRNSWLSCALSYGGLETVLEWPLKKIKNSKNTSNHISKLYFLRAENCIMSATGDGNQTARIMATNMPDIADFVLAEIVRLWQSHHHQLFQEGLTICWQEWGSFSEDCWLQQQLVSILPGQTFQGGLLQPFLPKKVGLQKPVA